MEQTKNRHNFLVIFLVALVAVTWTLPKVSFAVEVKPVVLKFAEDEPAGSMYAKTREWWAREIERRTGGRLQVKIYPGGTLANARNAIDAVMTKVADGGTVVSVFHPGKTPLATVSQNPVGSSDLYASYEAMKYLLDNYAPLQKEFAKFNQKAFWAYASGGQKLIATRPIENLSKLKGLKVRATAQMGSLADKLGAIPVFIPMGETYEGLQRGTAEGAMAGLAHMKPLRFYEVCKHLLMLEGIGGSNCGFGTINLDVWKSLPPDIQKTVSEVSNEYYTFAAKAHIEMEQTILNEFKAAGVTVYSLSADDKNKLTAAGEEVTRLWTKDLDGKGLPGSEILDTLLKVTAKYHAEGETKGYPWKRK